MLSRIAIFVTFSFAATCAFAQQGKGERDSMGELALSNDTLDLRYIGGGRDVGGHDSQLTGAFFLSEDRDIVLSAGLLFPVWDWDAGRLTVAAGPQVYAALLDEENNDVLSMTVGAQARFLLMRQMGVAITGRAFYSPDILTFGSADNLMDLSARIELQPTDGILAFVGMRWFEFDLTEGGGEQTLQEEIFVGIGYRF